MRLKSLLAAATVALAALCIAAPADARDRHRIYAKSHVVRHYVPAPRVHPVFVYADPYGYQYQPRGYYPYYNSGYWVPRHVMRYRYRTHYAMPPYYKAWGYPKPVYYAPRHRGHRTTYGVRYRPWHY